MKKSIALAMVGALCIACIAGCSGKKEFDCSSAEGLSGAVIVAEQGSAGEKVATKNDLFKQAKFTPVDSQAKTLMEVSSGTADFALIDYVMSIGSIGEGTDYKNLQVVDGVSFNPEQYGIAFRKGSDVTYQVNKAITELKQDGTLNKIASKYKLQDLVLAEESFEEPAATDDSDWAYIQQKGELIIGITYFAPMNYLDQNNELTGFETEFAKAVCEKLGVKATFKEIIWNSKETELAAKNIDCIWNGMTIDEDRKENMSISIPYMENKQVLVTKTDK